MRDRPTQLGYGLLGTFAFCLYAFGPALSLLRIELHLSYGIIGLCSSLWAAGAASAGFGFTFVTRALGRRQTLWLSAAATCAGALTLMLATSAGMVLAAGAVMGLAGTTCQMAVQALFSDRHGPRVERAFVESNIGAGVTAVAAPLLLGAFVALPGSWRTVMLLPVAATVGLWVRYRREALIPPRPATSHHEAGQAWSRCFWLLASLVAVGVGVEFCIIYFGSEQLTHGTGLAPGAAATAMGAFYAGILLGRIGGGLLTRTPGQTTRLVWGSLAISLAGFLVFWLTGNPFVAVAGLLITGLGVANLFPLSLALAVAAAPHDIDGVNARIQAISGLLVVVAPLLLGLLADTVGLTGAFAVEPALLVVSGLLLVAARHWSRVASGAGRGTAGGLTLEPQPGAAGTG